MQPLAAENKFLASVRAARYRLEAQVGDYPLRQNEREHEGARELVRPGSQRRNFAFGI